LLEHDNHAELVSVTLGCTFICFYLIE
jgi:hypothetical protein